jgi:hypothetical protein
MRKTLLSALALLFIPTSAGAQTPHLAGLWPVCDTLESKFWREG